MERKKGQRITGQDRTRLMEVVSRGYESGKSIRDLAVEHNISIGTSRNLLVQSGTPLRSRGGAVRRKRSDTSQ